jgi:hypothetical protein
MIIRPEFMPPLITDKEIVDELKKLAKHNKKKEVGMCANRVKVFIHDHEINVRCGHVFINHLGNVEIARCDECKDKPRFPHEEEDKYVY